MRTLKIVGTGNRNYTRVLDAETGADVGLELGISRIHFHVGDEQGFPERRLVLELSCPVILEIHPSIEKFLSSV